MFTIINIILLRWRIYSVKGLERKPTLSYSLTVDDSTSDVESLYPFQNYITPGILSFSPSLWKLTLVITRNIAWTNLRVLFRLDLPVFSFLFFAYFSLLDTSLPILFLYGSSFRVNGETNEEKVKNLRRVKPLLKFKNIWRCFLNYS